MFIVHRATFDEYDNDFREINIIALCDTREQAEHIKETGRNNAKYMAEITEVPEINVETWITL